MLVLVAGLTMVLVLIANFGALYRLEVAAIDFLRTSTVSPASVGLAAILPGVWPIVVCLASFVVVVGGIILEDQTRFLNWLDAEITRTKRRCAAATSFGAWLECRMHLAHLRTTFWGLMAIWGAAGLVVLINIRVIIGFIR